MRHALATRRNDQAKNVAVLASCPQDAAGGERAKKSGDSFPARPFLAAFGRHLRQAARPLYRQLAPLCTRTVLLQKVVCVLTSNCNSRCPVCFLWGEEGLNIKEKPGYLKGELPADVWLSFLAQIAPYGPSLVLTGGEVAMYAELPRLLQGLERLPLRAHLITNGTLFENEAAFFSKSVASVQISVDGPDEPTHQRARPGESWAHKLDLIRATARAGKRVHVGLTISSANQDRLAKTVERLDEVGVPLRVTILHQLFTSPARLDRHYALLTSEGVAPSFFFRGFAARAGEVDGSLVAAELERIERLPLRHVRRVETVPHLTGREIAAYYADPDFLPHRFRAQCAAPWLELDVMPDGSAYGCPDFRLGRIGETPLEQLLNGEAARRMRRLVRTCGTFPGCRVCASLYEYA